MKSRKSLVAKLDKVFSQYIRARDSKDGYFVCCSCGRTLPAEQADAGHFINRRHMATRWLETNVHSQCRSDNRFKEGNASGYALFIIRKYGQKHLEYLDALKNETVKYSLGELELMIEDYKNKLKNM